MVEYAKLQQSILYSALHDQKLVDQATPNISNKL